MTGKLALALVLFVLIFGACKQRQPERAFYYWKTIFTVSEAEELMLDSLKISKLYIRFFDVDWDEVRQEAVPRGKIRFSSPVPTNLSIIPVVYITNRVFTKIKPEQVKFLASKVFNEVKILGNRNKINFSEIQFDCDWTGTTRNSYFVFLQSIQDRPDNKAIKISATIRLHQVKYYRLTGIPPVYRGMLMFYNMGKIDTVHDHNSIFDQDDARKYTHYLRSYPLPLDVVLPAFSWGIQIHKGRVIRLLNNLWSYDFKNYSNFKPLAENMYIAENSFFYKGFYFMKGDKIKVEEVSPALCKLAADELVENMKRTPSTVAIYHLDSVILTRYEKKDFQKIFADFR